MISRDRFAGLALLCLIALTGIHIGCTGGDEAKSDQTSTPEARRLAQEKCDQAARIFYQDNSDPDNLRAALALYEEATALDPGLVEAHVGRGGVYRSGVHFGWFEQTSSLEKAEASFERAIELDPPHIPAYLGLIWVHFSRGDTEAMLRTGDRARMAGGPREETRKARAWAYLLSLMPDLALDLIEPYLATGRSTDPELQIELVLALVWSGNYREGIKEGNRFLEVFGEDPEIHLWIAAANHCLGNLETAKTHYDRSTELFGTHTNHYLPVMAGLCYEELGLREDARQIWEKAKITVENRLDIIQDNDVLLQSLETYRTLLGESIHPSSIYFRQFLAGALDHQGRVEEAVGIIDSMESGALHIRAIGRVHGFRDLDVPPYREALNRLEAREARLRESYGPL